MALTWIPVLVILGSLAHLQAAHIEKRATTRCMDDLGCFTSGGDFFHPLYRPIDVAPKDREQINVKFRIFTPKNKDNVAILRAVATKNFDNAVYNIDPNLETKIIAHGFIDNQLFGQWMREMKDEFFKRDNYNVIVVDWSGGNFLPYIQASANTRVVGAEIAFLVNTLKEKIGLDPHKVHLVGHSLGGQIVGYAGERIPKLGRITSFDPAEPYFQYMPPSVRIDPTDAEFVEVIHTDSDTILKLGLGMSQLAGHVDFFPNNGLAQPGCHLDRITKIFTDGLLEGVRRVVACNHQRAVDYFQETINSPQCQMVGYACNDWKTFLDGQCASCGRKGDQCAVSGINSDSYGIHKNDSRPIKLYFKTNSKPPFCLFHYQVTVKLLNTNEKDQSGALFIQLTGEYGRVEFELGSKSLYHGSQYTFLATTPQNVGPIKNVSFRWKSSSGILSIFKKKVIVLQKVRVVPMNDISENKDKAIREYCSSNGFRAESDKYISLTSESKC